jgi:hypothetical protein
MKNIFRKYTPAGLIMMIVCLFIMLMAAMPAQAGEAWSQKWVRFSATAGETLATGDVVCIAATDGYAYEADANDSDLRPAVGVIDKGGASGATVEIVVAGILTGQTARSPGARLYLSETAGEITTTAPTNGQVVGWVMGAAGVASSTDYFIFVRPDPSAGAAY